MDGGDCKEKGKPQRAKGRNKTIEERDRRKEVKEKEGKKNTSLPLDSTGASV